MTFEPYFFIPITVVISVLAGVWVILHHLINNHTLYRRKKSHYRDYSGYSLMVRTLRPINSAAKCKKCGDLVETHGHEGVAWCSCREVFVDNSYAFHVVGAKNLDNLVDLSIISVDKFTVVKK